ncbi:MAG: hypothetical protein JNM94_06155 [Phycisphaerae bacterium]|nr:hypothetical protein [Phycisphaerae bacterium]
MLRVPHLLVIMAAVLFVAPTTVVAGGSSLCCVEDLDADGTVSASDLGTLLGAWGTLTVDDPADIDGSGFVDATDLGLVLGAWGPCPSTCLKTLLVGTVAFADQSPVVNAVVVTRQGGKGISDNDGNFAVEVEVIEGTTSLAVTAVVTLKGVTYAGMKEVFGLELDGTTDVGVITVSANLDCNPAWIPTFGGAPGIDGDVWALAVFDDGSGAGPALYAAGSFDMAGGEPAANIAMWNGESWFPLGQGTNSLVRALAVFDDGTGPALYAGGWFTTAGGIDASAVAKWDGCKWSSLGEGLNGPAFALTVYDSGGGNGPSLIVGGEFTLAGGNSVSRIAQWDGVNWSGLGTGVTGGNVYSLLADLPEGSSEGTLVVGGSFTAAGGLPASRIARWDGTSWSTFGEGLNDAVLALVYFDDGSGGGRRLYAGGDFTNSGGSPVKRVATWNGESWAQIGSGLPAAVYSLRVFDDGSGVGPSLIAAGDFGQNVARWTGIGWVALGGTFSGFVKALVELEGSGASRSTLVAGGSFASAPGGVPAMRIASWDGSSWTATGPGIKGSVVAVAVFDDGTGEGPALYAAGTFRGAGDASSAERIARWNGYTWTPLGAGVDGAVTALRVFDDGNGGGPALYVAGFFASAGGVPASRIARWNGSSWSSLGSGLTGAVAYTLEVYDDGTGLGPRLFVGGNFTKAGGITVNRVAAWDGKSWSTLGSGMNGTVWSMAAVNVGTSGTALFVGGDFTTAGGAPATRIARWDGTGWSPVGTGVDASVRALAEFDTGDGSGASLFAGGNFTSAGGASVGRVARWDGSRWTAVGVGFDSWVRALFVHDDGSGTGPALYAGGAFQFADGTQAQRIAKLDRGAWVPIPGVVDGDVRAFASFNDRTSDVPALFVAGEFYMGPAGDAYLSKWGCQP